MNSNIPKEVQNRAHHQCELCKSENAPHTMYVEPMNKEQSNSYLQICEACQGKIEENPIDGQYFRTLNESIWSEVASVQVISYRLLQSIPDSWAKETLEMVYLPEEIIEIAQHGNEPDTHFDSNQQALKKGDSVTLIKDLDVKGSSLVAKRGTAVRNIQLVHDDPTHIIGKVESQTIYIKTEFVKLI